MSDKNESLTEAESKANNDKKIRNFVGGLGFQIIIMLTVIWATVQSNYLAGEVLYYYAIVVVAAAALQSLILFIKVDKVSTATYDKIVEALTPTATVNRGIAMTFSVVEISIMVNYGLWWIAGAWVFGEIMQAATVRKAKQMCEYREALTNREVIAELAEVNLKLEQLDKQIELLPKDSPEYDIAKAKYTELVSALTDILHKKAIIFDREEAKEKE